VIDGHYNQGYALTLLPHRWLDRLFSAFLQDQLKLTNSLSLTVGSKFEHNDFTGFEFEPSAQLVWSPAEKHTLWISASRAIREPSSNDEGLRYDAASLPLGASFAVIEILGNPKIKAEDLRDFEAGYRALANKRLSLDATTFFSFYRNLQATAPQAPEFATTEQGVPYTILPQLFVVGPAARTYGAEFSANWSLTDHWRISPGYSYFHIHDEGDSSGLIVPAGVSPNHQFQVRSLLDLAHHLEWDNTLGYVGKLAFGNIPAYARVDSRIGWRVGEYLELSIVGQNLLTPRHTEFADTESLYHTLVERSVFGKLTWRF
jgi:iron complex outermembrane receptor protein